MWRKKLFKVISKAPPLETCHSVSICSVCGRSFCEECSTKINGTNGVTRVCSKECKKTLESEQQDMTLQDHGVQKSMLEDWRTCTRCDLHRSRTQVVLGSGNNVDPKIFIVGQSPGETEDQQGKPFVGKVSWHLDKAMSTAGIDREKDCYITNSISCRPWLPQLNKNRPPTIKEITTCRPRLLEEYRLVKKSIKVIVLVGKEAYITWMLSKKLASASFRPDTIRVGDILGWQPDLPVGYPKVYAVYHPSYIARNGPEAMDRRLNKRIVEGWIDDWKAISTYVHSDTITDPRNKLKKG